MEQATSDLLTGIPSSHSRNKENTLNRAVDKCLSSCTNLEKLVCEHFPEAFGFTSCATSKAPCRTKPLMEVRLRTLGGNIIVLEKHGGLEGITLSLQKVVELTIETSLSPRSASSNVHASSPRSPNTSQKPEGVASANYKTKPCVYFQAGYCSRGEACTYMHGPSDILCSHRNAKAKTGLKAQKGRALAPNVSSPGSLSPCESLRSQLSLSSSPESQLTGLSSNPVTQLHSGVSDSFLIAGLEIPDPQSIEKEHGLDELQKLVRSSLQEPSQVACYSRTSDGNVHWDDRCLRRFRSGVLSESGDDLNSGYELFVEREDEEKSSGFVSLLGSLKFRKVSLNNVHFVTHRHNLNKILGSVYNRRLPWEMGIHSRFGTIFLDKCMLPNSPPSRRLRRQGYWGYAFEELASDGQNGSDPRFSDESFYTVLRTKLTSHDIIMGAEIDCREAGNDGESSYIELKTARELDHDDYSVSYFERMKLLTSWIQSFLAGVPRILFGFRDDRGILVRVESMKTTEITERVRHRQSWEGGVCLAYADKVLTWLRDTVKENEDCLLRFVPERNRLELLRADHCPVSITEHLEELCGKS